MIGRILEGEIRLVGVGLAGAVERLRRMELEAQEGVDGYGSSERERERETVRMYMFDKEKLVSC